MQSALTTIASLEIKSKGNDQTRHQAKGKVKSADGGIGNAGQL
jgi:hypothetical protein